MASAAWVPAGEARSTTSASGTSASDASAPVAQELGDLAALRRVGVGHDHRLHGAGRGELAGGAGAGGPDPDDGDPHGISEARDRRAGASPRRSAGCHPCPGPGRPRRTCRRHRRPGRLGGGAAWVEDGTAANPRPGAVESRARPRCRAAQRPDPGVVGLVGIEPTTSPLSEARSNRLSYSPGDRTLYRGIPARLTSMELLAQGRDCDIFDLGDGTVLRRSRAADDQTLEARVLAHAAEQRLPRAQGPRAAGRRPGPGHGEGRRARRCSRPSRRSPWKVRSTAGARRPSRRPARQLPGPDDLPHAYPRVTPSCTSTCTRRT